MCVGGGGWVGGGVGVGGWVGGWGEAYLVVVESDGLIRVKVGASIGGGAVLV